MALSIGQAKDFNSSNRRFFDDRTEYKRGVFLALYWNEHDLDLENDHARGYTLAREVETFKTLFRDSLGFEVLDCVLPSALPENKWHSTIGSVVESLHPEESYILVLYYAGHTDLSEGIEFAAFVPVALVHAAPALTSLQSPRRWTKSGMEPYQIPIGRLEG